MTKPSSPSLLALAAAATASLALGVGLAACVRTAGGPLPRAQGQPSGDAVATRGGAGYGGYDYGGYGLGGQLYGGASYGGDGYGGASYGTPTPPPVASIYACRVDADCTLIYRNQSCFQSDPIGVATAQLAAARAQIPVRREPCGMGGPDYERRRMENEGRYDVTCAQQRCTAVDHGPQRRPF